MIKKSRLYGIYYALYAIIRLIKESNKLKLIDLSKVKCECQFVVKLKAIKNTIWFFFLIIQP